MAATIEQIWSMEGDEGLVASFHKSYCPFKDCSIDPTKFTFDGSHIKEVTRCCGGFIRVVSRDLVPKSIYSKHYIRSLWKGDNLQYITVVKEELKMPDSYKSEFYKDIAYNNLFAEIIHKSDIRRREEDALLRTYLEHKWPNIDFSTIWKE